MDGILIVDKPKGFTSHDIVEFIRQRFRISKVGHAGTLDPHATGVLVILIGKFTKKFDKFTSCDKEYKTRLTLGVATDTQDSLGRVIKRSSTEALNLQQVKQIFQQFLGRIEQIPPMFSALKYKGKRLYTLARKGIEVKRPSRQAYIYKLDVTSLHYSHINFTVTCSKGTYIRTLCTDIAVRLGTVGHMSHLCRTRCGPFTINQAISLDRLRSFSRQQLGEALICDSFKV